MGSGGGGGGPDALGGALGRPGVRLRERHSKEGWEARSERAQSGFQRGLLLQSGGEEAPVGVLLESLARGLGGGRRSCI